MLRLFVAIVIAMLSVGVTIPFTMAQTPAQVAERFDTPEAQKMLWEYVRLVQSKQYNEAFDLLLSRKKVGDKWTVSELGDLSFEAPPEMARLLEDWVKNAAHQGDADAQFFLGYGLIDKSGRDRSLSEGAQLRLIAQAVVWLDKAADQGHRGAIDILSQFSRKKFESRGIKSKYFGE